MILNFFFSFFLNIPQHKWTGCKIIFLNKIVHTKILNVCIIFMKFWSLTKKSFILMTNDVHGFIIICFPNIKYGRNVCSWGNFFFRWFETIFKPITNFYVMVVQQQFLHFRQPELLWDEFLFLIFFFSVHKRRSMPHNVLNVFFFFISISVPFTLDVVLKL